MFRRTLCGILWLSLIGIAVAQAPAEKPELELGFNSEKELQHFLLYPGDGWVISKNGVSGKCLKYASGPVERSKPLDSFVELPGSPVGSFVLEVHVMQLPVRFDKITFCVGFGHADSTHYAFAQLSSVADRYTHNLFVVEDDHVVRILEKMDKGVYWGMEKWNVLRIERNVAAPSITVWLNEEVVFASSDARLMQPGRIRLGNSGDGFKIDNLRFWRIP